MNKISLSIILLFSTIWLNTSAQECDCLSTFLYTKNYIETNNPAFQKIKNNSTEYKAYQNQVKKLTELAKKELSNDRCIVYLEKYFLLLKDNHSGIDLNIKRLPLNFNSQSSIDSFKLTKNYQSFEKLKIDTTSIMPNSSPSPLMILRGFIQMAEVYILALKNQKKGNIKGLYCIKQVYSMLGIFLWI